MARKFTLCILALTLSLVAQLAFGQTVAFPQSVIKEMATRQMRYHHYLWHQVREGWNRFPEATKAAYRKIGWEPPRPARSFDASGTSSAINDNNSGEDFLYMHRQMIATANSIITKNKEPYGKIKGWTTIPAPGDKEFPVPPAYTITDNPSSTTSTNNRKTNSYYTNSIARYEKMFKDPAELRKMTLGELGARIDVTIHGWIHMRWSAVSPLGYRNSYRGTIPNIDKKWDNITYNWLGDSYASHVHPLFWKIHGWVDDRIEDWRKANGLTTIRWKGTWTGGPMSNLSSVMKMGMNGDGESNDGNIEVLEEAFRIFKESGVPEASFADDVMTDFYPPHRCKVRKATL